MDPKWELPSLRGTMRLGVCMSPQLHIYRPLTTPQAHTKSSLGTTQLYDVEFYPYTAPGVDPVFAVCGGPFTIICRCVLGKNDTIEILRWFEDEEISTEHGSAGDRVGRLCTSAARPN
ncbi:hypothetical protein A1F94_002415 [Pyrenophora tritici-repentis]|nr:hypothetical protein A1F94_002415 [Pyrenophora tritici-repentis]